MEKSTDTAATDSIEGEIAARLAVEEHRWQTEKFESLDRLAGGIAHEFNNFLAVIMLHTDMLNLQLAADSPHRHRINEIREVSDNAAATVRQLMAFRRKLPMTPAPTALNPIIENFAENLRARASTDFEIKTNLEPDLGACLVDAYQVTQILQNLAAHAEDYMPNGGTLKIETANIVLDPNETHESQPGGLYVQISVSNNGIGLEAETRKHIFEPFYSTDDSRKSAGLQLASVYGIVKQLQGFIWVTSETVGGTTFKIQFPRIDCPIPAIAAEPETIGRKAAAEQPATNGNETVLLVEDERTVRMITSEILKISGYRVFETSNGMEALEFAQSYNKPIHLLLTDVSMPLMNGRKVAEKITKLHPETAVMFMSGNIGDAIAAQDGAEENHFIGKPFAPQVLTAKVRQILEEITERRKGN